MAEMVQCIVSDDLVKHFCNAVNVHERGYSGRNWAPTDFFGSWRTRSGRTKKSPEHSYEQTLVRNGPSRVPPFACLLIRKAGSSLCHSCWARSCPQCWFLSARLTRLHKEKDLNGLLNALWAEALTSRFSSFLPPNYFLAIFLTVLMQMHITKATLASHQRLLRALCIYYLF